MTKLRFCIPQLGRRGFLRNCAVLGAGAAVFGTGAVARSSVVAQTDFVLINGWVLPSHYFRDGQA
ncbi:twin-arginine translocation signal domain-containing protein [Pantoea sp. Cy-639]|jgi:hypothetical protein|nr:twin-arginine translocation signal domain-containing protein [Pantoea sp. Cy-639]